MTTNRDRDDGDEAPGRSRVRGLLLAVGILTVPLVLVWWPGCRQYPEVSSKEALTLLKQLYTACNTRDPARLSRVEQRVEKVAREGKLTPKEQDAFRRILARAKAGDWKQAEQASFRFAQDQVR